MRYANAKRVNSIIFDRTNGASTGYAERLNGSTNEKYGLAKSMSVMPGDVISAEVYAKYVDPVTSNWTAALNTLIGQIAANTAGVVVDGTAYTSSTSSFPTSYGGLQGKTDNGAPKAYLNWLVFDRGFNFLPAGSGFRQITTLGKEAGTDVGHELVASPNISITQPGYVYIYLSNEVPSSNPVEVYFDDFKVTHTKSPVIQQQDYYPFGLTFNSYQKENGLANQFLYNGKELQDELNIGWLDYGARMYLPEIGRWGVVDPSSNSYYYWSPYSYVFDNPIKLVDPDGMDPIDVTNAATTYMGTNYEWGGKNPRDRLIGAKDRVSTNTSKYHTEASKNLRVAYDTKNEAMKSDIYFTFGVQKGCSFGIDCSGLVAKAFNADPDKLMDDLASGRADDQMKAFVDAPLYGTGTLHSDFSLLGQGDVVFQTDQNGEAHHTMIATGDVKTDKNGNVTGFKTIEATKSGDKVKTQWRYVDNSMKVGHTFRKTDRQNAGPVRDNKDRINLSGFPVQYQRVNN